MKYSTVSKALLLALGIPLASASAQLDSASLPEWSLSLGVDPTSFDLRTRDPGVELRMVGNLGRIWQKPGSRFSRNISLMAGGESRFNKRYVGLTAGVAADLFHVGRFTPYVQSGLGVYYTRFSGTASFYPVTIKRDAFSPGVNGGLGIRAKLGGHEFFVEQMLHAFYARDIDTGVYPLNFGFRF